MVRSPRPHLVIFDCDGVLVDSEPISISVLVDLIRAAGHEITEAEAYDRFLGKSMASIRALLGADPGFDVTPLHLKEMRASLYARFRAELQPVPGIQEALSEMNGARCVASSSQPERIALSLEITGLAPFFGDDVFSATMVENGKPAPDLFLHAARAMATAPADCLVIEDSAAGIEAARRAGMRVFAFTGGAHAGLGTLEKRVRALEPDLIFGNMRELPALLGNV
jgi:HAD superfamily hydrolase (TIGR01509 family)